MGSCSLATEQLLSNKRARLLVRTVDPVLARLLGLLVQEWGHELLEEGEPADLQILQEGCNPLDGTTSVWLTSARYQGPNRIALPLVPEELWGALEAHQHAKPRQHIRLETFLPAELRAGGERVPAQIQSLSDYGARLEAQRELARTEELLVHFDCAGQALVQQGRIIYCMPKGDLDGVAGYELGIVFIAPTGQQRRMLRDYIVGSYLQRVRAILGVADFTRALPFLHLSPGVRAHLRDSTPI